MSNNNKNISSRNFESAIFSDTPWALKLISLTEIPLKEFTDVKMQPLHKELVKPTLVKEVDFKKKNAQIENKNPIGELRKKLLDSEKGSSLKSKDSTEEMIHLEFKKIKSPNLIVYLKSCEEEYSIDVSLYGESFHNDEGIDVLFVGEKLRDSEYPILLTGSCSGEDLMGRMIKAMKIPEGKFIRRFIPNEINWESIKSGETSLLEDISREILFFKPKVVVCMGAGSTNMLLNRKERLTRVHGKAYLSKVTFEDKGIFEFTTIPIFHPDFLEINPSMKRTAWLDLQEVMKLL